MNLADMVRGTGDWVAPAPFVILGGGGHAKVVVGVLLRLGYRVLGYTDVARRGTILGIGCLGTDEDLPAILEAHPVCAAAMGLGKVDTSATRLELQRCVSALGFSFPFAREGDFWQWGYNTAPSMLTDSGWQLFVDSLYKAASY